MKIAIFVSGRGSNLEAILKARKQGLLTSDFIVISNNPKAKALHIAQTYNVEHYAFEPKPKKIFEEKVLLLLKEKHIDYIVLAGFMAILSKEFVKEYEKRIINIHPSLLPSFPGIDVHKRAIERGVKFSGCTVHFVNEHVDEGCIIAQAITSISYDDDEESLAKKILNLEHKLLPQVISWLEQDRIYIKDGKAHIKDEKNGSTFNPDIEVFNE